MIKANSPNLRRLASCMVAGAALLAPAGAIADECNESYDSATAVSATQWGEFQPVFAAYPELFPSEITTHELVDVQPAVSAPGAADVQRAAAVYWEGPISVINTAKWDGPPVVTTHWGDLRPLSVARLDSMRGGFEVAPGLNLSFGFERAVYINGELVASSRLAISALGSVSTSTTPSASALAASTPSLPLSANALMVSNAGNISSYNGIITGIQNTLNNQMIQVRTTIDATLSSLSQMRAQVFSDAFRQSAIDSARR
jgi:hypothetical protein